MVDETYVDRIYELLKDLWWFKGFSMDRQGELCARIAKCVEGKSMDDAINELLDHGFSAREVDEILCSIPLKPVSDSVRINNNTD